jgi:hypothetical protein
MKVTRILAALALMSCIAGVAQAQNGCARLSWGSCNPWVENMNYNPLLSPQNYTLNLSMFGISAANVGTDNQIRIRHLEKVGNTVSSAVPDAWRFDDPGCQTVDGAVVGYNNNTAVGCVVLRGTASQLLTAYQLDLDGSAFVRLTETWNQAATAPVPTTRYSLFNVIFDQSLGAVGPGDPSTCGGVDLCENFSIDFAHILASTGFELATTNCDSDPLLPPGTVATWNGGCQQPVSAQSATWGKLKGMYH